MHIEISMNQIEKLLQKYRAERDRLDWLIQTLEAEIGQKPSVTKGARSQRRQSGASTVTFAKKALQANIHGLMIPALLAEMKKLGMKVGRKTRRTISIRFFIAKGCPLSGRLMDVGSWNRRRSLRSKEGAPEETAPPSQEPTRPIRSTIDDPIFRRLRTALDKSN